MTLICKIIGHKYVGVFEDSKTNTTSRRPIPCCTRCGLMRPDLEVYNKEYKNKLEKKEN